MPYGAGEMAATNMASDKQELKNGMPAGPGDGPAKGERASRTELSSIFGAVPRTCA